MNNAGFDYLRPADFVLPQSLVLEILGRSPCRYTHKDYLIAARLFKHLEKLTNGDSIQEDSLCEDITHNDKAQESLFCETTSFSKAKKSNFMKQRTKTQSKANIILGRLQRFGTRVCMRRCIYLTTMTLKCESYCTYIL